ncbi:MAG: oligoendopeptidase F [Butyrivibrio sp.]|nr:oligoendopeptidase F [Butyrivibrio sp.]
MENRLPKRNEVKPELTWRLEDIYENKEEWEKDIQKAAGLASKIKENEGKIAESGETLYKVLELYENCMLTLSRYVNYASMRHDQDTADVEGQELDLKASGESNKIYEKLSFIDPEILEKEPEYIDTLFKQEPKLEKYRVVIKEIQRAREHSLSKEMEALLASSGEMADTAGNAFSMLINADLKFPSIKDVEGNVITLSNGRFVPLQMSTDRELRKEAFEKFYERYKEYGNTWAALYDGQVKQQIFYAKARKYNSTFEAAVDSNNIAPFVCDNLIESVHNGLDKMHRYVSLRKKLLGVDELHMYDVYAPMISNYDAKVTYEEAKEISLKALAPLGEEYVKIVKESYDNRWIDVIENEGKRGGAYSSGVYGVHPYMLLNYNNTLDDVFTLVHEMGHSMHTWYSEHAQHYLDSNYKIFVAEVASTTNEILLLEYLLKNSKSKEEKAYLINHYLESFKSTLYRQTMFEEFERKTNKMAEEGMPLTFDSLSKTYYDLNKQYFGNDMVSDELIAYEWCRIPHFYYNFYVYQYATSFSAAVAIAHRILEEGKPVVDKYFEFLKSGCTQDPVSLLKIAGVDLSTREPIDEALEVFGKAITDMETLMLHE